jgi:hypothetical protein
MAKHYHRFLLIALFDTLVGCSSSPLPPLDQIVEIRITVMREPDEANHRKNAPAIANLKERADIAEVMDWLSAIDWSQVGTDMAVIAISSPDGDFVLIDKAGAAHNYGFYWDGKFTISKTNRLIQSRDIAKLKQIVKRHCK